MEKVALLISGRAQPGRRGDVFALFTEHLAARAEANPAQEIVVWSSDERDPDAFYLFEVYREREALETAGRSPWFGAYLAAVGPLLGGQPVVAVATPLWEKRHDR